MAAVKGDQDPKADLIKPVVVPMTLLCLIKKSNKVPLRSSRQQTARAEANLCKYNTRGICWKKCAANVKNTVLTENNY